MSQRQLVEQIDDLIKIDTIFVSTTNKDGLVSNGQGADHIQDLPERGIIGLLAEYNPKLAIISTGGTAQHIREAGYNVTEISDFTGWPEMETGLVKSMNPKLYVGLLAHPYTPSDADYMRHHSIPSIDMVLVNFYPFQKSVEENPLGPNEQAFEIVRQNMDVGGPTAVHTSRKGFLTTAVTTRPADYGYFAEDLAKYNDCISLETRFKTMRHCSEDLAKYFVAINDFLKFTSAEHLRSIYRVNNPAS